MRRLNWRCASNDESLTIVVEWRVFQPNLYKIIFCIDTTMFHYYCTSLRYVDMIVRDCYIQMYDSLC